LAAAPSRPPARRLAAVSPNFIKDLFMEISNVTAGLAGDPGADPVSLLMLRKSLDVQAQGVAALLQAMPQPVAASNPPHLGQTIDIKV
jgi:hypothetical protein